MEEKTTLDVQNLNIYFKTADGEKITEYIRMFDESIKTFFEHIDCPNEAMHMIENNYKQYILKENNLL